MRRNFKNSDFEMAMAPLALSLKISETEKINIILLYKKNIYFKNFPTINYIYIK